MVSLFINEISEFNQFGKTIVEQKNGTNYFINEYWTSKQRQSHPIHEISYRACFKAELPEFFISRLSKVGDVVCDPFMGRGTAIVQAAIMGRNVIGNDINPLSIYLTEPRLTQISLPVIKDRLDKINWASGEITRNDLLAFYHPNTLKQIESLKLYLSEHNDYVDKWIKMIALNRLSGHSPGFFSCRSMPPNQAVSIEAQLRINRKLNQTPIEKNISDLIYKKSKALLKKGPIPYDISYSLLTENAANMTSIESNSVDLIVTSPPFLDVVNYAHDNWLRCWFADIDVNKINIEMHNTKEKWVNMMRGVIKECERILKPSGHAIIEVGEIRKGKLKLDELIIEANQALACIGVMINDQQFTKTSNLWGITNDQKGTNTNRMVILQKKLTNE